MCSSVTLGIAHAKEESKILRKHVYSDAEDMVNKSLCPTHHFKEF